VRERVQDDRPASVEVGQLLTDKAKLQGELAERSLATAAVPAWTGIESGTEALARAYGLKQP
jgi:hypothetical protein